MYSSLQQRVDMNPHNGKEPLLQYTHERADGMKTRNELQNEWLPHSQNTQANTFQEFESHTEKLPKYMYFPFQVYNTSLFEK